MKDSVSIRSSSNRLLTKKELLKLIDKNFEDDNFKQIAVITTLNSDINDKRITQQTITLAFVKMMVFIQIANGGTNDSDNLQCACRVCNNIKADVLPDEFMDKITEMMIHNMNKKYNKVIGRKIIKMIFTANMHRVIKNK